jgi:hypothetical protein
VIEPLVCDGVAIFRLLHHAQPGRRGVHHLMCSESDRALLSALCNHSRQLRPLHSSFVRVTDIWVEQVSACELCPANTRLRTQKSAAVRTDCLCKPGILRISAVFRAPLRDLACFPRMDSNVCRLFRTEWKGRQGTCASVQVIYSHPDACFWPTALCAGVQNVYDRGDLYAFYCALPADVLSCPDL